MGRGATFDDVRTAVDQLDVVDLRDVLGRLAQAMAAATAQASRAERRNTRAQGRALHAQHKGLSLQAKANAATYAALVVAILALIVSLLPYVLEKAREAQPASSAAPTPIAPSKSAVRARPAVVVKAKHLTLRAGPSTTQRGLATLRTDDVLVVVWARFGWLQVSFVDPTGDGSVVLGWVPARATSPIQVETMQALLCRLIDLDANAGHTVPNCRG